jgi:hypothetical protein
MEQLIAIVVSLIAGGLAGAVYTNWQTASRNKAAGDRVIAALKLDVARVRAITKHNADTAVTVLSADRPRAFIKFPTQTYELLVFSGQIATLTKPETLDAVLAYLQQAAHVNAMIGLFEEIEVQGSGLQGAPLAGKKNAYLEAIHEHCDGEMRHAVERLVGALT